MMWAATNPSPTRSHASAPARTEALTAPVSPRTNTDTYPPPTYSLATRLTSAAFVIASAASIAGTIPRVSIIPKAIPVIDSEGEKLEEFETPLFEPPLIPDVLLEDFEGDTTFLDTEGSETTSTICLEGSLLFVFFFAFGLSGGIEEVM